MADKVIDKTFNSLWNENHRKHNKSEIQYDDWLVKWLPQLKSEANILELGCGLGNNAKFLADNGIKELATDLSEVALENVAKIEGITTQKLDLTEPFAFEDESFDIVLADLCLHYFSESMTEKIMLEIKRVLKKDGMLLARVNSTADINHGAGQGEKLEENFFFVEGYNKRFFDVKTAQKFFGLIGSCQVNNAVMKRYEKEKQLLEICVLKKIIK